MSRCGGERRGDFGSRIRSRSVTVSLLLPSLIIRRPERTRPLAGPAGCVGGTSCGSFYQEDVGVDTPEGRVERRRPGDGREERGGRSAVEDGANIRCRMGRPFSSRGGGGERGLWGELSVRAPLSSRSRRSFQGTPFDVRRSREGTGLGGPGRRTGE